MGYEMGGFFGFLVLLLDIWAIIKIAQSNKGALVKFVWIAVVLLLPVLGVIIWYFVGPKGN